MSAPGPVPDPRRRLEGHLALLAVQLCFGLFPLFGKLAMDAFEPRAVAAWRIVIAASLFLVMARVAHGDAFWPRRTDWLRLQVCALLGVAVNQVLFLEGLQRAPSINAGVVMVLIPVFVFGLTIAIRQESLVPVRGFGVLVAASGASVLLARHGPALGADYMVGNLLMLANAFCYSVYLVLAKPLAERYHPLVLVAWVFVLSTWTVPLIAFDVSWLPRTDEPAAWWWLAYVVVIATVLAYLLNTVALARVAASTTAFYIFLQPLIAAAAGVWVLGETVDLPFVAAATLILSGLACVVWRPASRR